MRSSLPAIAKQRTRRRNPDAPDTPTDRRVRSTSTRVQTLITDSDPAPPPLTIHNTILHAIQNVSDDPARESGCPPPSISLADSSHPIQQLAVRLPIHNLFLKQRVHD